MVNSLFDKGRRDKVRDAVAKNEPLPGTKEAKPLEEPPTAQSDKCTLRSQKFEDFVLFQGVTSNDLETVKMALVMGANVNHRWLRLPVKYLSPEIPASFPNVTPLVLATELGFNEIADFLRANGAKE